MNFFTNLFKRNKREKLSIDMIKKMIPTKIATLEDEEQLIKAMGSLIVDHSEKELTHFIKTTPLSQRIRLATEMLAIFEDYLNTRCAYETAIQDNISSLCESLSEDTLTTLLHYVRKDTKKVADLIRINNKFIQFLTQDIQ